MQQMLYYDQYPVIQPIVTIQPINTIQPVVTIQPTPTYLYTPPNSVNCCILL